MNKKDTTWLPLSTKKPNSKPMKKKEIKWKEYSVRGYRIRTDGKRWEVSTNISPYIDGSLENHISEMKKIHKEHPDATVSLTELPYDDYKSFVIKWWVELPSHDERIKRALDAERESEERRKQYEENELERMRKKYPDKFKD